MKWMLPLFFAFLIGCTQEPANPDAEAVTPKESSFNLADVVRDYRDAPLTVLDVSERDYEGRNAIAVTLAVPIDPKSNVQRYFNVSEKSGQLVDGAWVLSNSGKTAWFPYTEPDTDYEITVYQGLTAANNKSLASNHFTNLHTRHLNPSFNFDTRGNFLSAGIGKGLPISSVNVDEVNIDYFRIPAKNAANFLQEMQHRGNYYWGVDELTQLGELAYSARYTLETKKNTRTQRTIDVGNQAALKDPGIYLAVMTQAGQYDSKQLVWFAVTDIGLHLRDYRNQLDVHASSLATGKALENIDVRLLDGQSKLLSERSTSPEGLASFNSFLDKARLVIAQKGDHYSVIELQKPALDLSEFDIGKRPQLPVELFVYTPRDLFRPGEVIDFNALIRDGDGQQAQATVLNAELISPDGSSVKTFKWQAKSGGYYHYPWAIPSNAMLGNWRLLVSGSLKQPISYSFKVEEFLPERMKLSFNAQAKTDGKTTENTRIVATPEETLAIPVLGEYLYGAPAAGNRLSTQVIVKPWRNPVESFKDFQFGNLTEAHLKQEFDLDDSSLDEQGSTILNIESQWQNTKSPLQIKLISSLYESGGRPVSRTYSSLVWPGSSLLGIRPAFGDKNPEANARARFDLIKTNLDGKLASASNINVNLIQEDRQYFWVYDNGQGWHYEWTDKEFIEFNQSLDLDANQPTALELPLNYGRYRLEVSDPETGLISSIRFYAGYDWYSRWQDSQSGDAAARPDKVSIALDKASYAAGDTAQVNIIAPSAGEALIMVESDQPLWMQRVSIPKEGKTLSIPIDKTWQQHNLYVTALVLQAGDSANAITPKRSFGLAHLALDRSQRKLDVTFDLPEKILPEQTYTVALAVNGNKTAQKNSPVYVTLAAVDVGVLSINNFVTPDPFNHFFGQRRYDIDSRDIYSQLIEASNAQAAKLRFGGDSDISRGGKEPQSEVQIVSLFSGRVDVNNGKAQIPLRIPDFNGRLRLMAVAFSENEFGSAEQELTVAAPIVTQASLPRFLAMGDQSNLALDVHNLSGTAQTLQLELTSSGSVALLKPSSAPLKLTLDDKEKNTLVFPIRATSHTGVGEFTLKISGENIEPLSRQWRLGVRPAYPAVVSQKSLTLDKDQSLALGPNDIAQLLPETVQASISASAQPNLDLQQQLANLLQYPYGCLEQTSSRAYPLTFATRENQQRLHLQPLEEAKRLHMIQTGIDHIATMQLNNGGFGLWSNNSDEEHWLTAYVADFLLNARTMNIDVSPVLIDKTLRRLAQYINRSGSFIDQRWSDDNQHYTFAYKAYAAYVLSQVNQAPLGSLRTLYDNHRSWAKTGLPQVQLGIALIRMGDAKRGEEAIVSGLKATREERRYYGDYGSEIRDNAMIIHLLLENNLHINQATRMSFELAKQLRNKQWLSTQERNALFLAGISLETKLSGNWQAKVILGAAESSLSQSSRYQQYLTGEKISAGFSLTSLHDKPLFATATISGYGNAKPEPQSNHLHIERTWYTKAGVAVEPSHVTVGDLFIVHLKVTAKERSPDALVVDLLPAGFELENQNLDSAIKLDNFRVEDKTIAELQERTSIKHQEYRDDRFVAALDVQRYQASHIFYLVRAVTPGEYKVPSPLVEDMYQPEHRGLGATLDSITINNVPK